MRKPTQRVTESMLESLKLANDKLSEIQKSRKERAKRLNLNDLK